MKISERAKKKPADVAVEERTKVQDFKAREREALLASWQPKTKAGKLVKDGEITSLDDLFARHLPLMEPEIVDALVPDLKEEMFEVRKTTRVTRSGRNFSFRVSVLVGDGNGLIGVGTAKDKEKWPAARKAAKRAKLKLVKVRRGCGSWECICSLKHSIPFTVQGKASSVRVIIIPAPKGTGLAAGENIKAVLRFAGIEDVWSKTKGNTSTKLNFVQAAINALSQTSKMKISKEIERKIVK